MNLKPILIIFCSLFSLQVFSNQFLEWEQLGPNNLGGITRSILVDRNNSNLIYAGSAGGGLYLSYDGGDHWEPYQYNELFNNYAIGNIKQASNGEIILSTGEPNFGYNLDEPATFIKGSGLYKLSNPEDPPILISSTDPLNGGNLDFLNINELELHPIDSNKMIIATNNNLLLTDDGGISWAAAIFYPAISAEVFDVKYVRSDDGSYVSNNVFAAAGNFIYKSINGGYTFNQISNLNCNNPNLNLGEEGRKEIAVSSKNPNYIYVSMCNFAGLFWSLIRSTDGGNCWEEIASYQMPEFNSFGESSGSLGFKDGWYNQSLIADPLNENRIFLGGYLISSWSNTFGWKQLSSIHNFELNKHSFVHPKIMNFTFDESNPENLFVATSGGIFKTTNASAEFPDFEEKSLGYNSSNFLCVASDFKGRVIGSTFNNGINPGCIYLDYFDNNKSGSRINGRSDSETEISHISENIMFYGRRHRSTNKGISSVLFNPSTNISNTLLTSPFFLWEDLSYWQSLANYQLSHKQKLDSVKLYKKARYFSGSSTVFVIDNPLEVETYGNEIVLSSFSSGILSALTCSKDGDIFWAASSNGNLIRVSGLNNLENYTDGPNGTQFNSNLIDQWSFTELPWPTGRRISGIAVNPENADQVILTISTISNNLISDRIYFANNATSATPTWSSIQYNFPENTPIFDIVFDKHNSNTVYIATEIGVWSLADINSSTLWHEENDGLGRCRVTQIKQEPMNNRFCNVTYISTYGKGIFRSVNNITNNPAYSFCDTELPDSENTEHNFGGQQTFNCNPGDQFDFLEINQVRALISTSGMLWYNGDQHYYQVPKYEGMNQDSAKNIMFDGGLWMGALDEFGQLKVAASTYGQNGYDYWPGPIINNQTEAEICNNWNQLFEVTSDEVDDFLTNGTITNNLLRYPARNNPNLIDQIGIELPPNKNYFRFNDVNNDGIYNIYDGDFPLITGDQSFHWIMNDIGNAHMETSGDALGVEIKTTAYAYNQSNLDTVTFYRFEVTNSTEYDLHDYVLGFWIQPILGYFGDNYVGVDTINNLAYAYNGDDFDDGIRGYGSNIPIVGIKLLDAPYEAHPINSELGAFMKYDNTGTYTSHPNNAPEYYNYLNAKFRNGQQLTFGGNGFNSNAIPTNFMYPSEPNDISQNSWSECSLGTSPYDRKTLIATKPINLESGETVKYEFAVLTTFDVSYPCPDISGLQNLATEVQAFYDDEINVELNSVNIAEVNNNSIQASIYPNPVKGVIYIKSNEQFKYGSIIDLEGKVNSNFDIVGNKIVLDQRLKLSGYYLLKLISSLNEIKTFKILIEE